MRKLFLLILIIIISGCGIVSPYVHERKDIQEADLSWYSILSSLNVERDQVEMKRRWNDYWEKLNGFSESHPGVKQQIIDKMKYCDVVVGMTEEQVLFMAKPDSIVNDQVDKKVMIFQSNLDRKDAWIKTWITIRNGVVVQIEQQTSTYGW